MLRGVPSQGYLARLAQLPFCDDFAGNLTRLLRHGQCLGRGRTRTPLAGLRIL